MYTAVRGYKDVHVGQKQHLTVYHVSEVRKLTYSCLVMWGSFLIGVRRVGIDVQLSTLFRVILFIRIIFSPRRQIVYIPWPWCSG